MQKSFSQGQLDGLCGIYSIVNAIAHVRQLPEGHVHGLFKNLCKACFTLQPLAITNGLHFTEMRPLLAQVNGFLGRRRQVRISYPFATQKFAGLDAYLAALSQLLDAPQACAILSCGEPWNHWTVAEYVLPDHIKLLDSSQPRVTRLRWRELALRKTPDLICMHPRQTVLISR